MILPSYVPFGFPVLGSTSSSKLTHWFKTCSATSSEIKQYLDFCLVFMEFPFQLTKVLLNKMELILSNQYDSTCYQYDDPNITGWVICLIAIHGKKQKFWKITSVNGVLFPNNSAKVLASKQFKGSFCYSENLFQVSTTKGQEWKVFLRER